MEKGKNIFIVVCVVIIVVLAKLLTLSLTGVLNIKVPNDNNIVDKNEENLEEKQISYQIVDQLAANVLFVNGKWVPLLGRINEVTQLNDILIVSVSYANSISLYAVDKEADIIKTFGHKANYRGVYRVEGNTVYVESDVFANGFPSAFLCANDTDINDNDGVIYEEKFTYLGNNKFNDAEVVNTVTKQQYMQEYNISCNN